MDFWQMAFVGLFTGLGSGLGTLIAGIIKKKFNFDEEWQKKWGVGIIVLISMVGFQMGKPIYEATYKPTVMFPKVKSALIFAAEEINKTAPVTLDENTILEKATLEGIILKYHYTLPKFSKEEINSSIFEQSMRPKLETQVCKTDMKEAVKYGGAYSYSYNDKNNELIINIKIDTC